MPARKDLGSLLVDEDVLDAKDLERVRDASPLWKALVERELASPDEIFRALSARFGVPVVSDERLGDVTVPDLLRRVINRGEAMALGLLPVDLTADGQRATVVMIDPSDEASLALFLTRAQVPEGRALLARKDALMRAIDRCLGGADTAVVSPLPPPRRSRTGPQKPLEMPVSEDDVTGTVKLDPALQAEIQKLPPRLQTADPLTPLPRPLPPRPKAVATPPPSAQTFDDSPRAAETPSEAMRAEERLSRALVETCEALASLLETRLGGPVIGHEMARLSRRVARQLNVSRRAADEIGVAAHLYAVDRALRAAEGSAAPDVFSALGWSASAEGGLLPTLRALTAASSGFSRTGGSAVPFGARIIGAVADYLELGAASQSTPDLGTVSQLLRASQAGAAVVDALLKVLQDERGDITPADPISVPTSGASGAPVTLQATSVLKHAPETPSQPTAVTAAATDPDLPAISDSDKTQRRPLPKKPPQKGE
jgi:hypothetical protein